MRASVAAAFITLVIVVATMACRHDDLEGIQPDLFRTTPLELDVPSYFPPLNIPADDPLTVEGVALGRRLYYDTLLSHNGPFQGRACASCHDQSRSFTVPGNGTSVLPHLNLAWSTNFLWNGKVSGTLEDILRFEVEDFFQVDVEPLRNHPEYPALFRQALGTTIITRHDVTRALAQWFRRLTSTRSKFDQVKMGQAVFTVQEQLGAMIFFSEAGDCFHCHTSPLMTDNAFHNIGLQSAFSGYDVGRYAVTGAAMDMGAFKTPTLRNIALTAPYMHDGRFQSLEEVIDFYSGGVQHSPSLDPIMTKPGTGITLGLTLQQKTDLIAFLHTLTDETFVTDPALGSPF